MLNTLLNSPYCSTLLTVATLQILAVMSPGPDFALVTRNSILHSRKIGIATALGITAGATIHVSYLVFGFDLMTSLLSQLLGGIKIIGAFYLGYLGIKSLTAKHNIQTNADLKKRSKHTVSSRSAFMSGLITNLFNPKAILFFVSLLTLVIQKNTPHFVLVSSGLIIIFTTFTWFLFVSLTFSGKLRIYFLKYALWIDRLIGIFLLFVAGSLLKSFY